MDSLMVLSMDSLSHHTTAPRSIPPLLFIFVSCFLKILMYQLHAYMHPTFYVTYKSMINMIQCRKKRKNPPDFSHLDSRKIALDLQEMIATNLPANSFILRINMKDKPNYNRKFKTELEVLDNRLSLSLYLNQLPNTETYLRTPKNHVIFYKIWTHGVNLIWISALPLKLVHGCQSVPSLLIKAAKLTLRMAFVKISSSTSALLLAMTDYFLLR